MALPSEKLARSLELLRRLQEKMAQQLFGLRSCRVWTGNASSHLASSKKS